MALIFRKTMGFSFERFKLQLKMNETKGLNKVLQSLTRIYVKYSDAQAEAQSPKAFTTSSHSRVSFTSTKKCPSSAVFISSYLPFYRWDFFYSILQITWPVMTLRDLNKIIWWNSHWAMNQNFLLIVTTTWAQSLYSYLRSVFSW